MSELERFAAVLRRTREASGMTQAEFAGELGIAQTTLCEYETGTHGSMVAKAARMFLALRDTFAVELEELV